MATEREFTIITEQIGALTILERVAESERARCSHSDLQNLLAELFCNVRWYKCRFEGLRQDLILEEMAVHNVEDVMAS